ncbi:MAG: hypothetical protein HQK54_17450, partial [Oligoflexales bacterium]|nr:hypothetical protein [Oligoflexales bacterium]
MRKIYLSVNEVKMKRYSYVIGILSCLASFSANAQQIPGIPDFCHRELDAGKSCIVSKINCDNWLCTTGDFDHTVLTRIPRSAIVSPEEAKKKLIRFELWKDAVRRRDPGQNIIRVNISTAGEIRYDDQGQLVQAVHYADFQANSPIGFIPMTMINIYRTVPNAKDPSWGRTFITTRIDLDTKYNPERIRSGLPGPRGVKYMNGYLHVVEEWNKPDSYLCVYVHRIRVNIDLAPRIADASFSNAIRVISGSLVDVMSM